LPSRRILWYSLLEQFCLITWVWNCDLWRFQSIWGLFCEAIGCGRTYFFMRKCSTLHEAGTLQLVSWQSGVSSEFLEISWGHYYRANWSQIYAGHLFECWNSSWRKVDMQVIYEWVVQEVFELHHLKITLSYSRLGAVSDVMWSLLHLCYMRRAILFELQWWNQWSSVNIHH
jgi:hypothetical protein